MCTAPALLPQECTRSGPMASGALSLATASPTQPPRCYLSRRGSLPSLRDLSRRVLCPTLLPRPHRWWADPDTLMVPTGTVARGRVPLQSASQGSPSGQVLSSSRDNSPMESIQTTGILVHPKLVSVCLPFSSVTGAAPLIGPTSHNTAEAATPSCLKSWCSLLFLPPPSFRVGRTPCTARLFQQLFFLLRHFLPGSPNLPAAT